MALGGGTARLLAASITFHGPAVAEASSAARARSSWDQSRATRPCLSLLFLIRVERPFVTQSLGDLGPCELGLVLGAEESK